MEADPSNRRSWQLAPAIGLVIGAAVGLLIGALGIISLGWGIVDGAAVGLIIGAIVSAVRNRP